MDVHNDSILSCGHLFPYQLPLSTLCGENTEMRRPSFNLMKSAGTRYKFTVKVLRLPVSRTFMSEDLHN